MNLSRLTGIIVEAGVLHRLSESDRSSSGDGNGLNFVPMHICSVEAVEDRRKRNILRIVIEEESFAAMAKTTKSSNDVTLPAIWSRLC